ncbi:transport and Golgi organization protein 6 homolog [Corticium candelabrum]|uniref:transport and Golgi organization protein 6 homolog n=1 Tax=Corticium candelabrum TaxID=121492 RepID=UPI002E36EFAF|nr:transport and Golgi organization protein 6 homolog [Corticium candelabrum]
MLWKRCEMVSQLVANCPRQAESVEEYYKMIGPQILNILKTSTQDSTKAAYLQVAVSTISAVFERNETLAWEYLLWPAMQPLCYMLKDSHLHSTLNFPIRTRDTWLLSSEEEVSECVECLHKMFVQCNCLGPHVAHHLSVVMPALVRLHCVSTRSVSHLRSLSQEVLTTFIKRVENKVTVTVLSQSLMPYTSFMSKASNDHVISDLDVFNNDMGLVRGPSGGLMVVNSFCPCPQSDLVLIKRNFQTECDWLVSTVQDPSCASGFLQILFEELGAALCVPQPEESDKSLLTVEETLEGSSRQHALILTNYCAALCQELSQSMFDDPVVLINFLAASFRQSVLELTYCKPGLALETLPLAIGLTSALLAAEQKVLKAHRTQINSLLPHLEVLSNEHPDSSTRELLCDIQIAIVTHGAVWSGISEKGDDNEDKVEETNGLFRGAMEELLDPLLPVRAHGLRQLTSLIQKRDPEATSNSDKLLLIFRQQLEHSDSYIYLAAINGLVALGDRFPDQVVSVLCKQFALFYGDDNGDVSWRARGLAKPSVCDKEKPRLNPDLRMKLGEALVKLTQLLGDLLPRYSQPLLSAVLCTVKDSDELVRASSMSNLATVCNRLQFSLGGVLHELLGCITAVVSHDPSPRVRRAAVLVVEKMITGLGKSCLEVMGDSIRDVYRLLKQVHASERDEQTRIQAEAALGELDSIMRQGLFPSQELRKKIVVLGDT